MAIKETFFGPKRFLTVVKSIETSQIADKAMYDNAGKKLFGYAKQYEIPISGPWCVLYFLWDESKKMAKIGIAIPVEGVESVFDEDLILVEIPKTKAAMSVLYGSYKGIGRTHESLMNYVSQHKLDASGIPVMAVEEYIVDPMTDSDPKNYVTNLYYLHN